MLTIFSYRPLHQLQHPNTFEYCEHMWILQADIPHMEIYIFPSLNRNSVWTLATQVSLPRSQICGDQEIPNAATILCHAVTSNAQTFTHSLFLQIVIFGGTCFHSDCQCSMLPAPRISKCCEFSSRASGSILCALALGKLHFLHIYRILMRGTATI